MAFEAFARHPDLAWPSNYTAQFPRLPQLNAIRRLTDTRRVHLVGRKLQYGQTRFGNRIMPMPNEAYEFWNLYADDAFAHDFMRRSADPRSRTRLARAVRSLAACQGKPRFAAKLTGPPRIGYLASVFPDAMFVHVVRDGRAVVHSLLNVWFWKRKGGFEKRFWAGSPGERHDENPAGDPGVLAALQWRDVVAAAREEAAKLPAGHYVELRYEDFTRNPSGSVGAVLSACGLGADASIDTYLASSERIADMNMKYLRDFSAEYLAELTSIMWPQLSQYGYGK